MAFIVYRNPALCSGEIGSVTTQKWVWSIKVGVTRAKKFQPAHIYFSTKQKLAMQVLWPISCPSTSPIWFREIIFGYQGKSGPHHYHHQNTLMKNLNQLCTTSIFPVLLQESASLRMRLISFIRVEDAWSTLLCNLEHEKPVSRDMALHACSLHLHAATNSHFSSQCIVSFLVMYEIAHLYLDYTQLLLIEQCDWLVGGCLNHVYPTVQDDRNILRRVSIHNRSTLLVTNYYYNTTLDSVPAQHITTHTHGLIK